MPAPFLLPAIPAGIGLLKGLGLAGAGAYLGAPIVSQLLSEIPDAARSLVKQLRPVRYPDYYPNGQQQSASQEASVQAQADEMIEPETVAPTPYEQVISSAAPSRSRSSGKRSSGTAKQQPQQEAAAVPVLVAEAPVAAPVTAPVPTTAELAAEEAGAILNEARAEQAAAEQAALDNRYNQLLAMYGIAPGSGAPRVNRAAAQEYYQDPSVYEALSRVYAGAPAWR